MPRLLQLALIITLTAAPLLAQITSPDTLVAPAPRNPTRHTAKPSDNLQWLWQYTRPAPTGNELGLLQDPRFHQFLRDTLRTPQSFWRNGKTPLYEVASQYFGVTQGGVYGDSNRYITVSACVAHMCYDQGLLWVDTDVAHPRVVFAATEWTTLGKSITEPDAEYNLWLFPSTNLDPGNPPAALVRALATWNSERPQHIEAALLVDPDGTPHKIEPQLFGLTPSSLQNTKK